MNDHPCHIAVVSPCYNEGATALLFIRALEEAVKSLEYRFTVIVVNDGSTDDTPALLRTAGFSADNITLSVVDLGSNMGHQAAIYHGLRAATLTNIDHVIVMDADGEDDPAVITGLLRLRDADIIHVTRGARRERVLFRGAYMVYKALFRVLTGRRMDFGNFSLFNSDVLTYAVEKGFTHFPVFLNNAPFRKRYLTADKSSRLGGSSKMNFIAHLLHALRSFAEHRRNVGNSSAHLAIQTNEPAAKAI